ncbi:MAG: hypothetical protein JRH13_05010 [Deltaproteobacteria bacterium]|nr:hypothetical protein [Deltaproteobacteria bacterium]MBW2017558.1 hypothetical protein [Deltaproteobacteria bacterium]MBW2128703.1 hypothetical protein [Deltaproteobacteria bacterium]MBW2302415.1 hypothetical protein [Deltaproteobacteria bacterium]
MGGLVAFCRNRCTSVEQVDEKMLRAWCRLQDTGLDVFVEIRVKLPDLEVLAAKGEVYRSDGKALSEAVGTLKKVVGIRVGPGMGKIIRGLLGEDEGVKQLAFMVEECCHGVILTFTKETLKKAPQDVEEARKFYAGMARENLRLVNRCAAYAPGSSLVEGLEPVDER